MRIRLLFYISVVLFMGNLNAPVDSVWHPQIPYFDKEHIVVGGVTALVTAILFGLVFLHTFRLEKLLKKQKGTEEKLRALSATDELTGLYNRRGSLLWLSSS